MINFLLFVLTILATLTNIWFSGVLSPAMVIRICLGGSMVVLQIWSFSRPISNETFRTKLLLEVITHRPSIAGKEWKTITYNMNQYLFKAGLWKTPYPLFFCEHQCYEFFQGSHKGKIS
nr:CIH_HP1_G0000780.mRNA.1.CDS.1 [Saccharomyces cerevisiae]